MSRRLALLCGVAGPAAFVGAWVAGGLARPAYDPVSQAISQLAREGASTRPLMTAGFVGFGVLVPVFATVLPPPARIAATASALATLGVAALPLSAAGGQPVDTWHAVAAGTGYVGQALAPALGSAALPHPRLSQAVSVAAALCLVASLALPDLTGLLQRTGLTLVDAWFVAVALHGLRSAPAA